VDNPALCEHLNGDVASCVQVNFGNKSLVSCSYCSYLVLVDFESVLSRSTLVECFVVQDHLQVTLGHIGKLLIQTHFPGSPLNL